MFFSGNPATSLIVNSGLCHFGYRAPTGLLGEANGRGSNGGVWEWTSTEFARHEGFDPTTIFPGQVAFAGSTGCSEIDDDTCRYSSDFFDGKHQVVVSKHF